MYYNNEPITRIEKFLAATYRDDVSVPDPVTRIESYMNSILSGNASDLEPTTRIERYLAKISGADVAIPDPTTRIERYLAIIAGGDCVAPVPITRIEKFLADWIENGLDELPTGYKRVLGFSCNNNAMWEIPDFYIKGTDTLRVSCSITATSNLIGSYSGSSSGENYSIYASTSNVSYLRYYNTNYNSQFDVDTRYDIVMTPTGTHGMKKDSEWETVDFTTSRPFCIGTTAANIATSAKLKGSLYGNIIVDGRLHLVPCERLSDNVLGYYDTYGKTFYPPYEGFDGAVSLGYDDSY